MSAKWEKTGTNVGKLTFSISTDKIKEGLDKAFAKNKKNITLPGFRKGKVSRSIFDAMYGEEALYQDALNILLPEVYPAALKEAKVRPVDQPRLNIKSLAKGKPWVLEATVTVEPSVKLGDYKGVPVHKQDTRVYKKDVDSELNRKRHDQAELVLKQGPAAKGDTVIIDFAGYIDGKPFKGGKATNYSLKLGSHSFVGNFEDQLVGHKDGDKVDVNVTFPKNYQAKQLRNKKATFKVTMHEVKEEQLPKLNDEFAKDVDEDVDTLDELKDKIKKQLKNRKASNAKNALEDEAIGKAVDNATVKSIPKVMMKEDTRRQMDQYLANMQQQGINAQTYYKLTGTTEADLKKQFANGASRRVKTNLVLEAIVKAEKINPTKADRDKEIKNLAKTYGMKASSVRSALTPDMLNHDIAIEKAVQMITKSAKQEPKSYFKDDKKSSKASKK
ncbi:trigger factor [Acetilactobacillus jinshanensis]|uniref:Trigger factor n=1 Tax=Acetilactobacillus jinshanensis TaxID=1720083 RepID=A0A4P6ZKH3_9LACO|nr:trigger factor [Acetilactobacillus jinshanensis]QBP17932.1 trigger factor [Acetilactobacillus jinshanensis]URL60795.1 trigger factor [uncultured bacterium]